MSAPPQAGPDSLAQRAAAGYCTDEWRRWQQGGCDVYAVALTGMRPGLRLGVAGETDDDGWLPRHFFAHDGEWAYDSAGRHPLPYHGIDGQLDVTELDHEPEYWGVEGDAADLAAAAGHARRNRILDGAYGPAAR